MLAAAASLAVLLMLRLGLPHSPKAEGTDAEALEGEAAGVPSAVAGKASRDEADDSSYPDALDTQQREAAQLPALSVTIASERGQLLSDVLGCWVSDSADSGLPNDLLLLEARWEELLRGRSMARSGEDGALEFSSAAGQPTLLDSTLILHEPSHGLHWIPVAGQRSLGRTSLKPVEPLRVHVTDADGSPAAEASVRVLARERRNESGPELDPQGPVALIEQQSPASGEVRVGRFQGRALIIAERDGLCSEPWIGDPSGIDRLTLHLRDTLVASGRLLGDQEFNFEESDLKVVAFHLRDGERRLLRSVGVGRERRWAMEDLPRFQTGSFVFRLEGPAVAPDERTVALPAEGPIVADLDLRLGSSFEVRVRDHEQNLLTGVRVEASWGDPDPKVSVVAETDDRGVTTVACARPGDVWLALSGDGFVRSTVGPFATDMLEKIGADLYLGRAGNLRVTCLREGRPVSQYTLRYWEGLPHEALEKDVDADEFGGVTLEDVPIGDVKLFAFDDRSPASEIVSVSVASGEPAEVELELRDAVRGTGRVVDSETGFPIQDAVVEVHLLLGTNRLGACSAPVQVDSAGVFGGLALPATACWIDVRAPGYAVGGTRCEPGKAETFDIGAIELSASGTVEVKLVGRPGQDLSAYMVDLSYEEQAPRIPCTPDGRATFEGIGVSSPFLTVWPPDAGKQYMELDLRPGERWYYEIPLFSDSILALQVLPSRGEELVSGMWVGANFLSPDGIRTVRHKQLPLDGRVEFDSITGEQVVIEVWSPDFDVIAARKVSMPASGTEEVVVELVEGSRRICFVDTDYEPIADAAVNIKLHGDDTAWMFSAATDAEGAIELRRIADQALVADVLFGRAVARQLPIEFAAGADETTVVVVDVSASVRLRAVDGDLPLEGAKAGLSERAGFMSFDVVDADAQGYAQFGALSPRSYQAEVYGKGLWTAYQTVDATSDYPLHEIQVRRVGSLSLMITRGGAPLAGALVELTSREFGEVASQWLAEGRIQTSTGDLRSDAHGQLSVFGLPHGEFAWRATFPSGAAVEGELVVIPMVTTDLVLDG